MRTASAGGRAGPGLHSPVSVHVRPNPTCLPATSRRRGCSQCAAVDASREDTLVGEEPLEIRAAGPGQEPVAVAVTMRTPGSEAELAVGFLRTEGLIGDDDVDAVEFGDAIRLAQPDDTVIVRLRRPFDASVVAERHFVATASCGICGKASLDEIAVRCDPIPAGVPVVDREVIVGLPATLREAQRVFEATGGLHAAGLFEPDGRLVAVREDVGRHNALDKLVGWAVLAGRTPLNGLVLLVSGRVSLEIVQKAAVAGIPIVCAVSAPSDLAVEAADPVRPDPDRLPPRRRLQRLRRRGAPPAVGAALLELPGSRASDRLVMCGPRGACPRLGAGPARSDISTIASRSGSAGCARGSNRRIARVTNGTDIRVVCDR